MDNQFFERMFENIIDESAPFYLQKEENKIKEIEVEEVNFSDLHKAKMEKLFKQVRMEERREKAFAVTRRMALIVLCAVITFSCLIGSVEAWRKEVIKFIMKQNPNNYMSIAFCDPSGDESSGETETNSVEVDGIKFLYVPEGFEYEVANDDHLYGFYHFKNGKSFITFKIEKISRKSLINVDLEDVHSEMLSLGNKEVFKTIKANNRIYYVWYDDMMAYSVLSNIEDEKEVLKFIENIKILKNF